jgi:hypothetical protein
MVNAKSSVSATDLETSQLAELMMVGTGAMFVAAASVRLLVRHGYWLTQESFLKHVDVYGDPPRSAGVNFKPLMAELDNGQLPGDHEQQSILQFAASLLGWYPIVLRHVSQGIDAEHIKHVAEAIMYADGFLESVAEPRA